jgi:hypothetical protein
MIWNGPTWNCPHCKWTNAEIREICRNCGYDSNAGEFPYYNPLPPYAGSPSRPDNLSTGSPLSDEDSTTGGEKS